MSIEQHHKSSIFLDALPPLKLPLTYRKTEIKLPSLDLIHPVFDKPHYNNQVCISYIVKYH